MKFELNQLFDLIYDQQNRELISSHVNPINRAGRKCFSQNEEDGMTFEIVKRLGIRTGTYIEFGVGNGIENNTLALAALGWKGAWVGNEELCFTPKPSDHFRYYKNWITLSNLPNLILDIQNDLNFNIPDVFSVDLDGNDIHIVDNLLKNGVKPRLWIVEYNARFIPPIRFHTEYRDDTSWTRGDFFGASLCSYVDMFAQYDYQLIATNALSGSNAFFIQTSDLMSVNFEDIPRDIDQLYSPSRYFLYNNYGHGVDPRTVEKIINR